MHVNDEEFARLAHIYSNFSINFDFILSAKIRKKHSLQSKNAECRSDEKARNVLRFLFARIFFASRFWLPYLIFIWNIYLKANKQTRERRKKKIKYVKNNNSANVRTSRRIIEKCFEIPGCASLCIFFPPVKLAQYIAFQRLIAWYEYYGKKYWKHGRSGFAPFNPIQKK